MASTPQTSSLANTGMPEPGLASPLGQRDADRAAVREVLLHILSGDVSEIFGHRRGACRHCFGVGFRYQWRNTSEYAEALRAHLGAGGPRPDHGGGTGYTRDRDPLPDCPHCEGQGVTYLEIIDTLSMKTPHRMMLTGIAQTRAGIALRFADRIAAARLLVQLDQSSAQGQHGPIQASRPGQAPGSTMVFAPTGTIQVPAKTPVHNIQRPYRREEET